MKKLVKLGLRALAFIGFVLWFLDWIISDEREFMTTPAEWMLMVSMWVAGVLGFWDEINSTTTKGEKERSQKQHF